MIVCQCHVVNDAAIRDAVDAGARTLSAVCRTTGAGSDCGGCVFSVRRIVCEHEARPVVDDIEVCDAAS